MLERLDEQREEENAKLLVAGESEQSELDNDILQNIFPVPGKLYDLKDLDKKISAEHSKFIDQVEDKAYELACSYWIDESLLDRINSEMTPTDTIGVIHSPWISKQKTLDSLKQNVLSLEKYIYTHATQFVPLTLEKTKRQAKIDALVSYTILQRLIKEEDYKYKVDPKMSVFVTIHNKAFRNFIIYLVTGIAAILATAAILACIPLMFAALGVTHFPIVGPLLVLQSKLLIMSLTLVVASLIGGAVSLLLDAAESFNHHRQPKDFANSAALTVHRFFHEDAKKLLGVGKEERMLTQAESKRLLTGAKVEPEPTGRPRALTY